MTYAYYKWRKTEKSKVQAEIAVRNDGAAYVWPCPVNQYIVLFEGCECILRKATRKSGKTRLFVRWDHIKERCSDCLKPDEIEAVDSFVQKCISLEQDPSAAAGLPVRWTPSEKAPAGVKNTGTDTASTPRPDRRQRPTRRCIDGLETPTTKVEDLSREAKHTAGQAGETPQT